MRVVFEHPQLVEAIAKMFLHCFVVQVQRVATVWQAHESLRNIHSGRTLKARLWRSSFNMTSSKLTGRAEEHESMCFWSIEGKNCSLQCGQVASSPSSPYSAIHSLCTNRAN